MKNRRIAAFVLLVLVCMTLLPNIVYANAAEWPPVTVLVPNAPDDLEISLRFTDGSIADEDVHSRGSARRGWETYFRWYVDFDDVNLENAVLTVSSSEKTFECAIPTDALDSYNVLLTLDLDGEVLKNGAYTGRYALIVAIRVIFTLLMEGVIFFLFGYRQKRSWVCFLIINLITQAGVNIALYGANYDSYVVLGFILVEVIVFIAEMTAFPLALREDEKGRAVLYAFIANAVSLIGGGFIIANMPV